MLLKMLYSYHGVATLAVSISRYRKWRPRDSAFYDTNLSEILTTSVFPMGCVQWPGSSQKAAPDASVFLVA